MVKTTVCCDVCGNPLPVVDVITPIGVIKSVKSFTCTEWDISCFAPDLCELCALKIDMAVSQLRREYNG